MGMSDTDSQHADRDPSTDDLGFSDQEESDAYEQAQPEDQPTVSSEPEPDEDPAQAG